jgi:outer membrane protein assembly factor BamB
MIGSGYIALDLATGQEHWRFRTRNSFQSIGIDDGFIVVFGDSFIRRIDNSGRSIWRSDKFPSLSMRAVFPYGDNLYAPFRTSGQAGIHVISIHTGEISYSIDGENIVGVWDDLILKVEQNSLVATHPTNESVLWSIELGDFDYIPEYDDVLRYQNLIILSMKSNNVAYDVNTGVEVWRMTVNSNNAPLLLEDRLYVYSTNNELLVYGASNGARIGQIDIGCSSDECTGDGADGVALAGYGNIVSIAYIDLNEILTIQIADF